MIWSVWWAIYGCLNILRHRPIINQDHGLVAGILAGPSIHLWYLPVAILVLAGVGSLKQRASTRSILTISVMIALLMTLMVEVWRPWSLAAGAPMAQWTHAVTPVAIGLAIGCAFRWHAGKFAVAVMLMGSAVSVFLTKYWSVPITYLIGSVSVLAALVFSHEGRVGGYDVRSLSSAMLGVYLVHPIFLAILRPAARWSEPVFVLLAFIGSTIVVLTASRVAPRLSHVLLGTMPIVRLPRQHMVRLGGAQGS